MFKANMLKNREALEAEKSATVLFHEAIEEFDPDDLNKSFKRFERAAAKGHEEAIWIVSVMKVVKMEKTALREAFAKTEEPLGYCLGECFQKGVLMSGLTFSRRVRMEDVAGDKCFMDSVLDMERLL